MSPSPPWLEKILKFSCLKCLQTLQIVKNRTSPQAENWNSNSSPKPFLPRHFESDSAPPPRQNALENPDFFPNFWEKWHYVQGSRFWQKIPGATLKHANQGLSTKTLCTFTKIKSVRLGTMCYKILVLFIWRAWIRVCHSRNNLWNEVTQCLWIKYFLNFRSQRKFLAIQDRGIAPFSHCESWTVFLSKLPVLNAQLKRVMIPSNTTLMIFLTTLQ